MKTTPIDIAMTIGLIAFIMMLTYNATTLSIYNSCLDEGEYTFSQSMNDREIYPDNKIECEVK